MTRTHSLCLDGSTAPDVTPAELIAIAAEGGCQGVGLMVQPHPAFPDHGLSSSAAVRRETIRAAHDHGLRIDMADVFVLDSHSSPDLMRAGLEAAAELGAHFATAIIRQDDEQRRIDQLAEFAHLAERHGLHPLIEFIGLSSLRTLAEALAAIERTQRPNLQIEVDSLNLFRSGSTPAELLTVPVSRLGRAQISDGPLVPALDMRIEATYQRMLPGEGEFPLVEFINCLPDGLTIGIEAQHRSAEGPPRNGAERARMAIKATRAVLQQARHLREG